MWTSDASAEGDACHLRPKLWWGWVAKYRSELASNMPLAVGFNSKEEAPAAGIRGAVFVANLSDRALALPSSIGGKKVVRVRTVDAERNFADASPDVVAPDSVALVEVE